MYETPEEIDRLQALLASSRRRATSHLQEIVSGDHALSAGELLPRIDGMRVLSLATVTAKGEPRVSAVDGHFIHGSWTFGTDGRSAKARHLSARPAVSAALFVEIIEHWTGHYDSDPRTWGEDIRLYRIVPHWCVAYVGGH
jgi:hypothetical protein